MKTYLDMDEILHHCRRYIGQEYDEPYLVSAVPEEVIRSLPPADVVVVRHAHWIVEDGCAYCSDCRNNFKKAIMTHSKFCPMCGAKMDGWKWCVWQNKDNKGVYCTAHIHEDRVLNCPYKNLGKRQRADYPCQDYRPMNGGQDDV